ncbi:MAG: hypothetical protein B6229_09485 [Spirochaetaceae bacterium 4572_7]|nr:MAG: hypothetical protein B6229_09485 [Spirochaetaceae bacterium 4572_7]
MKKLSILFFFIFLSSVIFAGDVAHFVNLGFSPNGNYLLFGEYGIDASIQEAYANMWLVDVKKNNFVKGGVFGGRYKTVIEPGESSVGALLKLITQGSNNISKYKIDFLDQGRPLYVRINDNDNINSLDFRDFASGLRYRLNLDKKVREISGSFYSSFKIDLETIDQNGKSRKYSIGNPSFERKNIKDYKIERILHSSKGDNIVVVISKSVVDGDSINIRYMVETISLK